MCDPEWEVYEPVPPRQLSEVEAVALLAQEATTKQQLSQAEEEQEGVQKELHAAQRAADVAAIREWMPKRQKMQDAVQRLTRGLESTTANCHFNPSHSVL